MNCFRHFAVKKSLKLPEFWKMTAYGNTELKTPFKRALFYGHMNFLTLYDNFLRKNPSLPIT